MLKDPSYSLSDIQRQMSSIDGLHMTGSARCSATELGFSDEDVVAAVAALTGDHFYKSMAPFSERHINMHDVYKAVYKGIPLYIKFQLAINGQFYATVSFKEDI